MWILRKVQESAESLPVEISRLVCKNGEEISAKAKLLNKIHNNVLTPDKIPDFFLPPKLSRRPLVDAASQSLGEPDVIVALKTDKKATPRGQARPIPFSLKSYESGLFESPHTRRKESLFHSSFTHYTLERMATRAAPNLLSIAMLKVGSVESETSSSADSSPHCSPPPARMVRCKREVSDSPRRPKELLHKDVQLNSRNAENKCTVKEPEKIQSTTRANHNADADQLIKHSTLTPPLRFPLDMLHCEERLHSEHVLLLPCRGSVRLSASRSGADGDLASVRIRVISVEGLRDAGDLRPLHCGLILSLSPGKLQRQNSATIRHCRNPVFNEDFFFTEPEGEEGRLQEMDLRVKVVDKASGLGRALVLGIIVKPLSQLVSL